MKLFLTCGYAVWIQAGAVDFDVPIAVDRHGVTRRQADAATVTSAGRSTRSEIR